MNERTLPRNGGKELDLERAFRERAEWERDVAIDRALVLERELETNRAAQEELRLERNRALGRIGAMESTKFWKLRRVWFRLRRLVGAPGPE